MRDPVTNQRGVVLMSGLMFMAVLMIMTTTAVVMTSGDYKITRNYFNYVQAFNRAEAGRYYGIQRMQNGLAAGTFTMPVNIGDSRQITDASDPIPGQFNFALSSVTRTALNRYQFTSTGTGNANAPVNTSTVTVQVTFRRASAINFGAFGDELTDMKSSSQVYSFDSATTMTPTPFTSTGEGDVGSNGEVQIYNGTVINGDIALGDDGSGTEAVLTATGTPIVTGTSGSDVDRVDPDPLGVVGGEYAQKFTTFSTANDNASANPAIAGNTIGLGNGDVMTLVGKPGGANYYLNSITLNNGASLNIDNSAGPVNIFLTGAMEAKNGSNLNVSGKPTDFAIFSNSTSPVVLKHGSDFHGLCYAPYATVEMKNSGNVYGAVWGSTVSMKNSAVLYYDTALQDQFQASRLSFTDWREMRN